MKPIAQTFYINEPENGVAGVYLTSVDLYFRAKSPSFGVQVQIRLTENGNPTKYIVPHADITLNAEDVNISEDASVSTKFTFKSPVFLQSLNSYAIVIIPVGGNTGYEIWTAELAPGTTDVTTNSPIKTNNDTGTLFLSSNDIQFTAIQNEDIKFKINIAKFKSTSGTAVFTTRRSDYVSGKDKIGNFDFRERVVMTETSHGFRRLTMSSNTAAFQNGEVIYQSNSTVNAFAYGIIHSANLTTIKITNNHGTWVTGQVKGVTSLANATISAISSNVVVVEGSNTVTVPFTNTLSVGQMIYVGKNNGTYYQPTYISSILSGTTFQTSENIKFSETDSIFGKIKGDGGLYGSIKSVDDPIDPNNVNIIVDNVTSNTTVNFSKPNGKKLIGIGTGSTIRAMSTYNSKYNTVVPQFAESKPDNTNIDWSFIGIRSSDKTLDSDPIPLVNNVEKELYDFPRQLMSRSNEYTQLTGGRAGETTTRFFADMSTSNNYISPMIDYASRVGTFLSNKIVSKDKLYGYKIVTANNQFVVDDIVVQKRESGAISGKGVVESVSGNLIFVSSVEGSLYDTLSLRLESDDNVNTNIVDLNYYSEKYNSNNPSSSRYISKSVILADGQDAEDIRVFLTAYRPASTDFLVYARFLNGNDRQPITRKNWTLLEQRTSPALLSSTANKNDFIEIEYGLPSTMELFADSCSCNSTSKIATIRTNDDVTMGDFVYFADTQSDKFFVSYVSEVSLSNKKSIYLSEVPDFAIANASFGVIPNLEAKNSAFVYSRNNNIIRYMSNTKDIYDSYKTFAIKIVPVAESSSLVPRAKDMRAIALQV